MSWRDDLPPIPAERLRDAVMNDGPLRVRRRRQRLGAGASLAVLVVAGLAAVALQQGSPKPTSIAANGTTTTVARELPPDAQGSSGISGRVTVSGRPGAGVTVDVSYEPCCLYRSAYAAADGTYAITGLPAGSYRVGFSDGGAGSRWYDDKPTATDADRVTLADGEQRTGIDGALIAGAGISGRVTSQSGVPLAGVWVTFNGQHDYGKVETGADGRYSIDIVPPGDYTIQFDPVPPHLPYIGEYYNNKPETGKADRIHLEAGDHRTGVDAALLPAR
jgi:hypothetical protein